MPTTSELVAAHYEERARLAKATAAAGVALWTDVDREDIAGSWASKLPRALAITQGAQLVAASKANEYTTAALESQGVDVPAMGDVNPRAFTGVASDGRPLESLLYAPVGSTLTALSRGATLPRAMATGLATLDMIMRTQVEDAGRTADGAAIAARPTVGYVRVLSPPSCSRCAVLAGRYYRWNTGFRRHPRCDCLHVPAKGEKAAKDEGLVTSPKDYFESLSRAQQDRVFTRAGAEAIRDGADISQVINARRGMSTAGLTTEGMSRRGFARSRLGVGTPRLMPETIYRQAKSREEAVGLLRLHGYIV